MVRKRSELGNSNGNQQRERVMGRASVLALAPEPITIAMIQAMLDFQMEGTRLLLQGNRDEPTALVMQRELEEERSKEGNYSRTISQAEPRKIRRNNPNKEFERNGCKYKGFMVVKPPSISRSPALLEVIEWISKMEMVFESYDYGNRKKTILEVRQLKKEVLSWRKLLVDSMPKGEARKIY